MYKLKAPAWAFDYNSSYGTSSNVPSASRFSPSYSYLNMNAYIYKNQFSAFVQNAQTGTRGQGIAFYGTLNSTVINNAQDLAFHKEATHVWSMAIPINMGSPIGLFTANINAGVYYPPNYNIVGPSTWCNYVWYIDNDHMLKIGSTYRYGSSAPPDLVYNFGVDMTPYMYIPTVNNMDDYCGHRYAMRYSNDAYELYVDNVNTRLAVADRNIFANGAASIMNQSTYYEWMNINGGGVNNYSYIGPGAYMYTNSSTGFNTYNQGNVYMSDWYGWETSLNDDELQAVFEYNWRARIAAKTSSSYGALQNCNYLTDMVIPGSMKNVGRNMMYGCNNISSLTFKEGVENISQNAIYSLNNVKITLPTTIKRISSYGFYCYTPVVPTLSYNVPIYDNMCRGIETDYPFNMYEKLVEMTYSNPLKQQKPANLTAASISISTSQVEYNMQSELITYSELKDNSQIIFNTNVNKAVHTNLCTFVPSNITDDGFDVTARSIEFPSLTATTHCTFLDDAGFICTYAYGFATIIGHTTNEYDIIPNCLDNAYIVREINMQNNLPSRDILIECPNELTQSASVNHTGWGLPNISKSFNNCTYNITIKNAYYVAATSSFKNTSGTVTFDNCRYISIDCDFNNSKAPVFINCPNISFTDAYAPVIFNMIETNPSILKCLDTMPNINVNGISSVPDLEINYWRSSTNYNYLLRCNEAGMWEATVAPEAGPHINNMTLNSLTVHNYFGTRNACGFYYPQGTFSLAIDQNIAYCASNNGYLVSYANMSSVDINATLQVLNTAGVVNTTGVPYVPLTPMSYSQLNAGIAQYSNIASVNIAVRNNPHILTSNVIFNKCNIDTINLLHNEVPSTAFYQCNINSISSLYDDLFIGANAFANSAGFSAQPIVGNTMRPSYGAFRNAKITDTALYVNLHGNQDMRDLFSLLNGPTTMHINMQESVYGTAYELLGGSTTVQSVSFTGKAIPGGGFANCRNLTYFTDNNSCIRIAYWAFRYSNNLTTVDGLKNCAFISTNAFINTGLSSITLNPHVHIGSNAIAANIAVSYYDNCPVDLNISNNHTSTSLAVKVYDDLHPLLKVNLVYEDGTEVPADNFYVEPPVATVAASLSNRKKCFVYAGGLVKQAALPYSTINTTWATQAVTITVGTGNAVSVNVHNNSNGFLYAYTANKNASLQSINSSIPVHTITAAGSITYVLNTLAICRNNCRIFVLANTAASTVNSVPICNSWNTLEYSKWMMGFGTLNMNVGGYYSCTSLSVIDLDTRAGQCIMPMNFIYSCNSLTQLYLPNSAIPRIICSNAVRNCPSLTLVDFSGLTNTNIVIYNNAFVNCYGLTHIDLPSGVKNICTGAFNRTGIKAVNVPTGCVVGTNAFPSDCVITYI